MLRTATFWCLGVLAGDLDQVLAALFGQRRDRDAQVSAFDHRIQAEVRRCERPSRRPRRPPLSQMLTLIWRGSGTLIDGDGVQLHHRAVGVDHDLVEQAGRRATCAQAGRSLPSGDSTAFSMRSVAGQDGFSAVAMAWASLFAAEFKRRGRRKRRCAFPAPSRRSADCRARLMEKTTMGMLLSRIRADGRGVHDLEGPWPARPV